MKFITAEQFLEADRKVQESVIRWWEPSIGDLTESKVKGEVWCLIDDIQVERALEYQKKYYIIPLLTVGQLIEFIEWKTKQKVEVRYNYFNNDTVKIALVSSDSFCIESFDTNILIDALWMATQKLFE